MTAQPLVIGLVGGIGSGKSTFASCLGELGCVVVDADAIAHDVLQTEDVRSEIEAWWGSAVLDADGTIDRAAVGRIVFADVAEKLRLEALVHPLIQRACREVIDAADSSSRAVILDAPLLLEVGLDAWCDIVVFIEAPDTARRDRVHARSGWGSEEWAMREQSQIALDEKRLRSDHVLVNADDSTVLRQQAASLLNQLHPRSD
ncbi:MAG: dephospho-CoA kinase [Phycisphaerales bacterium]|nr:dephospho-CoA kinase [Phycisphaerales bacterium]